MSNPISDGIKRLRYQHKLTPTKLSQMVDIPHATLANMESGNSNPGINLVVNVAQALRASVDDLISKKQPVYETEVKRNGVPHPEWYRQVNLN